MNQTNRRMPTATEMEARRQAYGRERAVDTAYHEAAHAVVEFLYGRAWSHLIHISMVPEPGSWGFTRRRGSLDRMLGEGMTYAPEYRSYFRGNGMREIIFDLAGPAVDAIREDLDVTSLDWLISLADDAVDDPDGCDYAAAYRMTSGIATTERQRWAALKQGAKWTDELVRTPRVWSTIAALAGHLKYGEIMQGETACEIMQKAWGDGSTLPLADLGRKWMRRLFRRPSFSAQRVF